MEHPNHQNQSHQNQNLLLKSDAQQTKEWMKNMTMLVKIVKMLMLISPLSTSLKQNVVECTL